VQEHADLPVTEPAYEIRRAHVVTQSTHIPLEDTRGKRCAFEGKYHRGHWYASVHGARRELLELVLAGAAIGTPLVGLRRPAQALARPGFEEIRRGANFLFALAADSPLA
jgi:hypothetical protein